MTWEAVANATGYTATATPSGGTAVTGPVPTGSVTGTEADFTGLTANTTYTVSITAIGDANYNNSRAETLSVTTLADAAPAFAPGTTIPAQIWTVGTPVNLTLPEATGGDGTLSYTLTPALPAGVTLNTLTREVSGTPTSATSTTAYTWRTTDSDSDTAALTFSVTVDRATLPSPMNLAVKPDTQTRNGFTVTWDAVANATGYTATATPSGGTAVTGSVTGTEAAFTGLTANTTYTVSITAIGDANYNNSRAETLSVTTLADTAPAFAQGTVIPAQIWTVDTPVNLALPEATGGDGTLSYTLTPALPAGVTLNASTRVVSGTPTSATSTTAYTWRTTDSDSNTANSDTAALTFGVTVGRATLPSPMNLAVKPDTQTETGFTVTWEAVANATGYTATAVAGSTTVNGTVSGTGTEAVFTRLSMNTTYTVTVVATGDANYNNSRAETLSVTTLADTAPAFAPGTTIPAQIWTVGTPVNLALPEATGGNGTISYTLTPALPAGVMFNASTRVVSGTPTSATSTTTYTWRTADSDSDTAALTFNVTVGRATLPSLMNLAVKPDTQTETGFTVTWEAVANATGYTATATPSGGTAVTGTVTGTEAAFTGLTANTTYTVSITATGNANYNNSRAETLSVTTLADTAPAFAPGTTIPAQIWTVGTPVNLTLPGATGGDGTLSYTLTPALPAGVTLNASTRVVSGTPTSATSTATYTWRTTDSDSNTANSDTAALTFGVTVDRATLPSPMNLAVKPDTQTQNGFTVTWEAVANATGYTATATPSGGTAVTGSVTGTEAAFTGLSANTTYTVSITATGNANYNNSRAETLSVTTLADTAPTFAPGTTIPAQIWTVDTPVNLTLPEATGGNGTISYTLTPALPAGVTLNASTRVVSGTPTSATSTTAYTWRTTDSDSNTANSDTAALTFQVTVGRATLPPPMNLALQPDTQTETGFTVSWEAVPNAVEYVATATPTSSSGEPLTGTAVAASTGSGASFGRLSVGSRASSVALSSGAVSVRTTRTEATFTGLLAGTEYDVSVTAIGNASYANSQVLTGLSVTTLGLLLTSAEVEAFEDGERVVYMLELATQPRGDVMVTALVSGESDDVAIRVDTNAAQAGDQNGLVFTPSNWNQPQAISLRGAAGVFAASRGVLLTLMASGANYDGVSLQRAVVPANVLPAFSLSLGAADAAEEGTELLVAVGLSPAPVRYETVRVRYAVGATGDTASAADWRAEDGELVFGAGETTASIRIEIEDDELSEPEETLTVTLLEVSSSDSRRAPQSVDERGVYAIAGNDALQVSLDVSVPEIIEGGDAAIFRVSLTGGVLETALVLGVSVHPNSSADAADLAGLPSEVIVDAGEREAEFSVRALQEPGVQDEGEERLTLSVALPASLEGDVAISRGTASVVISEIDRSVRGAGLEAGLGAFARGVGGGLVESIGERARALEGTGGEASSIRIAGAALTETLGLGDSEESGTDSAWEMEVAQALQRLLSPLSSRGSGRTRGAQDMLADSDFLITPAVGSDELDAARRRWSLWGEGSLSRYILEGDETRIDGELLSARVAFDMHVRETLLAGVAVGRDVANADYRLSDGEAGSLDIHTTGLYPYVHWRPTAELGTWGMAGYGAGKVRLDDGVGDAIETDMELGMIAAGIHRDMFVLGKTTWALKSDALLSGVEADEVDGGALLPSTSARVWRLRTALQGTAALPFANVSGSFQLGALVEGGEAYEGGGVEAGAGLIYVNPEAGIEAQLKARWMSSLRASRADERGVSLRLTYDSGMPKRGLSLTAAPEWGRTSAQGATWEGLESLGGVGFAGQESGSAALHLPVRVAYGIHLGGERLFTPVAEWTSERNAVRWRAGAELFLPQVRGFDVQFGVYRQQAGGDLHAGGSRGRGFGGGAYSSSLGGGGFAQGAAFGNQSRFGPRFGPGFGSMSGPGYGVQGFGLGNGVHGYAPATGHHTSGFGAGAHGFGGVGAGGYSGSPGDGITLEALLSRTLGEQRGRVSLSGKALNSESSLQFEMELQLELLF